MDRACTGGGGKGEVMFRGLGVGGEAKIIERVVAETQWFQLLRKTRGWNKS